jgi:EmrB/QacA subfamily drug resistance transporter
VRPILVVILVAYLMIVIDSSIVITALPEIRETFGMTDAALSWVQNAYLLAYGGFLLVGARVGDLLGRRRTFVAGVAGFTAASLAVGAALSAPWLLAARACQGLAAAILAPAALSLLQASFRDGVERTRAVAYHGTMAGVGAMLGLVLGGACSTWLSWRAGFLVNVPIGLALVAAARRRLSETEPHGRRLDLVGAITSTLAMTALVYGLVRVASGGWGDSLTTGLLVTGAATLVVFVVSQARAKQPIMPLRLFASRERSGAYVARALFVGAIFGSLFFLTLYLQRVLGLSPFVAGLAFLPMMLANFCGALVVPRLAPRVGGARLLAAATVTASIGMAWLSRISPGAPYLTSAALPMLLVGVGGGACLAPLTASGIAGVAPADAGAASGLVNVAHQIGGSLGLAVLLVVSTSATPDSLDATARVVHEVGAALVGGTVLLALALVVVLALIVPSRPISPERMTCRKQWNRAATRPSTD